MLVQHGLMVIPFELSIAIDAKLTRRCRQLPKRYAFARFQGNLLDALAAAPLQMVVVGQLFPFCDVTQGKDAD